MIFPQFSAQAWVLAVIAAFCCGLTKSGFGGFGLITVLLMAMILPAKESTGALLPLLIVADLMATGGFRRHVNWRELRRLLPSTLIGVLSGWMLMGSIPDAIFGAFLGWMILLMMVLVVWQRFDGRILDAVIHHPVLAGFSGFAAGVSTMMANAGGPAMTFYLLAKKFDKMAFVGTCAWFFFITNLSKVPLSLNLGLITSSSLALDLALTPVVAAGFYLGKKLLGKVSQGHFEWIIVAMAVTAAFKLILD